MNLANKTKDLPYQSHHDSQYTLVRSWWPAPTESAPFGQLGLIKLNIMLLRKTLEGLTETATPVTITQHLDLLDGSNF